MYNYLNIDLRKIKFLVLILTVFVISNNNVYSQTYEIDAFDGQTIVTCSGTFTDSNPSSTGNYGDNENYTVTFCSGNSSFLTFDFDVSGFYDPLSAGDTLYMYDGVGTGGDLIMQIDGTDDPSFSQFMLSSLSTCVTFQFISDGAINNDGWGAIISCTTPPADCNGNPAAADISAQAPFICNLDGYCGNTSNYYHEDLPFNMTSGGNCPSTQAFLGTVENNSWLVFEASSSSVDLDFSVTGCGTDGIQTAIMQYDGSNWVRYSDCATSDGSNSGTFTMSATGMTPGEIYYIMVDGNAGANCDYSINVSGSGIAIVDAGIDQNICENDDVTLSASGPINGTYTWHSLDGIVTNLNGANQTFTPLVTTTYVVEITGGGICENQTDTVVVTVNSVDDGSYTYLLTSYCTTDTDPTPTITGLTGGNFTINGTGSINNTTGIIDLSASGAGSYTITYSTMGACPATETFDINIADCTTPCDVTISTAGPFCLTDPSVILSAIDAGGTWSGTGITNGTTGTFDPATAGIGNHIISYTIAGTCGSTDTETIVVNTIDNASFTYPLTSYCLSDTDHSPTVTGLAGGTFSINNGGSINSSTGVIDLTISGANTFTVSYLTNGTCPETETFDITITASSDATITAVGPFCQTATAVNLTATDAGGTWSGTGITNGTIGTFDPATAGNGNHIITYTIAGTCGSVDTETIAVNAIDNASFAYALTTYCLSDTDPSPTVTGLAGGTFSINNGGSINSSTGAIDLTTSGTNTFTVSYLTNGTCPETETFDINITASSNATITPAGPFCQTATAVNLTATDAGGTWSGTGITNGTTGTFDPATAGNGNHIITYTIAGTCGSIDTETIVVNEIDDASFTYPLTSYCLSDTNPSPTITGLAGGTFSINNGGSINSSTGVIDLTTSGANTFTISYLTNGACPETEIFNITITALDEVSFNYDSFYCVNDVNPLPNITGVLGGTFTINNGGSINSNTGEVNVSLSNAGNFEITYTTNGNCGNSSAFSINIINSSDASITEAGPFCLNDEQFNLLCTEPNGIWTGNGIMDEVDGTFSPVTAGSGTHQIIYTINGSCGDADTINVIVYPTPVITISADTLIEEGGVAILNVETDFDILWSPSESLDCETCNSTISSPSETTTYCAIVTDNNSCSAESCVEVGIKLNCGEIFVPNAFSPNNDSNNDFECVMGNCISQMNFKIYDRWGELVFESSNVDICWDGYFRGKLLNTGVYVYTLQATLSTGESVSKKGNINLIR